MKRDTDLRVIKTKRRIKEVFGELISKKELRKITVTELAKTAEINKGTFYLHYKDIYELYNEVLREEIGDTFAGFDFTNEFFDDPQAFIFHFYKSCCEISHTDRSIINDQFFSGSRTVFDIMETAFKEMIYKSGRIVRNDENDIKLSYIFFNLFRFVSQEQTGMRYDVWLKMISDDIKNAFSAEQEAGRKLE